MIVEYLLTYWNWGLGGYHRVYVVVVVDYVIEISVTKLKMIIEHLLT